MKSVDLFNQSLACRRHGCGYGYRYGYVYGLRAVGHGLRVRG